MTNLVKRLRSPANVFYEYALDNGAFLHEAADYIEKLEAANLKQSCIIVDEQMRIEKLETALRFYACDCKPDDGCGIEYYDGGAYCGHAARKALEGKDER